MKTVRSIPEVISCYVKTDNIENMDRHMHSSEKIFNVTNTKYMDFIPNLIIKNNHVNDASITSRLNKDNKRYNNLINADLIYNYTDTPIYVRSKNNFPIRIDPVPEDLLKYVDKDKIGQIDIFTIYPVYNSNLSVKGSDINDYLVELDNIIRSENSPYSNYEEVKLVVNYLREHSNEITNYQRSASLIGKDSGFMNYPIYYVNVLVRNTVDIKEIYTTRADGNLYVENKNIIISIQGPNTMDNMESILDNRLLLDKATMNLITDDIEATTIFIVDTQHKLTPRFINFMGKVKKIYTTNKPFKPVDGLYIETYNKTDGIKEKRHYPLANIDEIDNLDFIFKSKEEAEQGRNKDLINKLNLSEKELQIENARKDMELENIKNKLEALRLENENLKIKQKADKENHDRSETLSRLSHNTNLNKYEYENKKYYRDSTLEGIKTGGLIVTTLTSLFLVAQKYKNSQ